MSGVWQDRETRFDLSFRLVFCFVEKRSLYDSLAGQYSHPIVSSRHVFSLLKPRPGEEEIDSMNSIEDTKGNNGEKGINASLIFLLSLSYHHCWAHY